MKAKTFYHLTNAAAVARQILKNDAYKKGRSRSG